MSWRREGAKKVETPLGERPRAGQCLEVGGRGLLHRGIFLTLVAASNKLFSVSFHRWPVVAKSEGANVECLALYVIAANPGVELVEDLFSFFWSQASE